MFNPKSRSWNGAAWNKREKKVFVIEGKKNWWWCGSKKKKMWKRPHGSPYQEPRA